MGQLGASEIISKLFLLSFYVNFVLIISNLFPLLPLDGYFIMSTLMKMPNLRKQSSGYFAKAAPFYTLPSANRTSAVDILQELRQRWRCAH